MARCPHRPDPALVRPETLAGELAVLRRGLERHVRETAAAFGCGQDTLQAIHDHEDRRFFEQELSDALFDLPADLALCRRMLRAGVRFAHLEEVVAEHHESSSSPDYEAS